MNFHLFGRIGDRLVHESWDGSCCLQRFDLGLRFLTAKEPVLPPSTVGAPARALPSAEIAAQNRTVNCPARVWLKGWERRSSCWTLY